MESTLSSSTGTLRLSFAKASAPPLVPFCLPIPFPIRITYPLVLASLDYLCPVLPVGRSGSFIACGGGGGSDSNKSADAAGDICDVSESSPDVIVLHVGGMTCGGCAASVKRILESQPQVSSASVNLTTETAIVCPFPPEAKSFPNWRKQLGELLAKHLSSCGFTSYLHGQRVQEGDIEP